MGITGAPPLTVHPFVRGMALITVTLR